MSRIVFFCIPAHGHTNPTLGVVRELLSRGNEVIYYSYEPMREKIEATGALFIACDKYDPQTRLSSEDGERVGKDLAFSTELIVRMTLALDDAILEEMKKRKPDVIVADSVAYWGKLIAGKLGIPFVSSTTTFAFNRYSAKIMKREGGSLWSVLKAMPKIQHSIRRLRTRSYEVKNVLSIIENDNDTDTVVYTSREFQPCAETFSEHYAFVGPMIRPVTEPMEKSDRPTVYISLGTVMNHRPEFYKNCIQAFRDQPWRILLNVGELTEKETLGEIPEHIQVMNWVDQIAVLKAADVFVTHCGMNSVNEALYFGVPMVLVPQTPEQAGVANRTEELGAGKRLDSDRPEELLTAVQSVLKEASYRKAAEKLAKGFHEAGGAKAAADKIEACAGVKSVKI